MALGQRAAEDGEVLGEDIDEPAVDRAGTGDDAVAGNALAFHAEVDAIVLDVHVIFFEAALIEQHGEPLAGCQAALRMLGLDTFFAAAHLSRRAALFEFFDGRGQGHISLAGRPSIFVCQGQCLPAA